jgi:hypothetical protein
VGIEDVTVADLIAKLSVYPADSRVTLLDPQRRWLLPIQITRLSAVTDAKRVVDFIAITAEGTSDEIEGIAPEVFAGSLPCSKRIRAGD